MSKTEQLLNRSPSASHLQGPLATRTATPTRTSSSMVKPIIVSDKLPSHVLKGSVSSSMPCTCRLLANLCLSPFSWAMKMATTKANQEATRARHAG